MFLLLMAACGVDTPEATLDDDNWLSGSFVDEFDPEISAVLVELSDNPDAPSGYGADITYMDGDVEVLVLEAPCLSEQSDELPDDYTHNDCADAPELKGDLWSSSTQGIRMQWTLDGETMSGSFEGFMDATTDTGATCDGSCQVEGAFSASVTP